MKVTVHFLLCTHADCVEHMQNTLVRMHKVQCVAVYCSALQCAAAWCCVLQCIAVCCSVLQCHTGAQAQITGAEQTYMIKNICCGRLTSLPALVAACYSVLQRVAVCYSALQCVVAYRSRLRIFPQSQGLPSRVAACCSVLQLVAIFQRHKVSHRALQRVATNRSVNRIIPQTQDGLPASHEPQLSAQGGESLPPLHQSQGAHAVNPAREYSQSILRKPREYT